MRDNCLSAIRRPRSILLLILLLMFTGVSALAPWATGQSAASSAVPGSAPPPGVKADYVVIKPVANMFRKPTVDSDVVSQTIYATNVSRLKSKHGWVNVRTADEYTGWIQASSLRKLKGQPYATGDAVIRVSQRSANFYREPDVTRHAPLLTLPWESRMEVVPGKVDEKDRWLKVRLADGSTAFVQQGDVSSDFAPLTVDQMISTAKRFLGTTYTWGGASAFGFDCSGFTQMLMRQRGMIMPRDADLQAAWSGLTPVERKDLQPGDLLYFGDRPDHITHAGMYIGNGQFIHDTTHEHPGVQISVLDEKPWTTLLVAARRPKS